MKTLTSFFIIFLLLSQAYSQETISNRSRGGFQFVESAPGFDNPEWDGGKTDIEFADINQDGHIDIVSIGDNGSPEINTDEHGIMVWFGSSTGIWSLKMNGDFGYGGIAVGDANRDGLWDIGYGMHHNYSTTDFGDQLMEVVLGDGTGENWIPWDNGLATNGETNGMFATDFADINNDGYLDMGSLSFGSGNGIHIYLNNGDGTWTQSYQYGGALSNSNYGFYFGDINKDGFSDCVAAQQGTYVFFGDGTGNFTSALYNMPNYSIPPLDVALGDVDGDGGKDLALINNNGGIEVWIFVEDDENWVNYSGSLPMVSNYNFLELFDLNNDGNVDLLASGQGELGIWSGDGTGNWSLENTITTANGSVHTNAFRVGGDVDHNGFADIALVQEIGGYFKENYLKCLVETTSFLLPSIKVVFPMGGEVFYQNSDQFTDWLCAIDIIENVIIDYSVRGKKGPWIRIESDVANSGRYQWTIPQTISSNNCFLRYSIKARSNSLQVITPNAFTILGDDGLEADFITDSLIVQPLSEIQFTDRSLGLLTSWEWDFDNDGIVDATERNPVYSYSQPGTYTVKLVVSDGQNNDTEIKMDYITVTEYVGVNNTRKHPGFQVYPNPFSNVLTLKLNLQEAEQVSVNIYDLNGRLIHEIIKEQMTQAVEHVFQWEVIGGSMLLNEKGLYLMEVRIGDKRFFEKVVFSGEK